jgi:hypothetical protein
MADLAAVNHVELIHKHAPAIALCSATLKRGRRAITRPTSSCASPVISGLGTHVAGSTVIQINSTTWRSTCDKQMQTMTKGAQ